MLVLNGIVGLCLILGGARHYEQSFQTNAAASALSVLGTLAVITLVLPNYTIAVPGPFYSRSQLIFIGTVSIVLYGTFLFVQTIRTISGGYCYSATETSCVRMAAIGPKRRTATFPAIPLLGDQPAY
ncbi:MAG: hypothetical protein ACLP1W_13470 [Rhodomicrobium sp.]